MKVFNIRGKIGSKDYEAHVYAEDEDTAVKSWEGNGRRDLGILEKSVKVNVLEISPITQVKERSTFSTTDTEAPSRSRVREINE